MNVATRHNHLMILDHRSRFATVALAWQTESAFHAEVSSRVRRAASAAASADLVPVSEDWTVNEDAICLTAMMPEEIVQDWVLNIIRETQARTHGIAIGPVLAVVGSASTLGLIHEVPAASATDMPHIRQSAVPSTMRKTTTQGVEHMLITGQDPAEESGSAATFLAICLIAAGPGTVVSQASRAAGRRAHVKTHRGLQKGKSTLTWHIITPQRGAIAMLDAILCAVSDFRIVDHPDKLAQAEEFARGSLNKAWRSPIELARSLVQYHVMGWGGELILDPDAALGAIDSDALEHAIECLIRPIKEVFGRS